MPRLSHAILSVLGAVFLVEAAPREAVNDWTVEDFDAVIFVGLEGYRDFENGRRTFEKASCLECHRFGPKGPEQSVAPDLTKVGERESPRDLLESILHPAKKTAPGYEQRKLRLKDGRTLEGMVRDETGSGFTLVGDPRKPEKRHSLKRAEVAGEEVLTASAMPSGLLDPFDEEDVLDLLAYLLSGGRPEDAMFRH